jgi:hypothetical protein
MRQIIDSGIPRQEIEKYFEKTLLRLSDSFYYGNGCLVELQSGIKGVFVLRTIIIFIGPRLLIEELVYQYRMAFLRGGA